MLCSFLTSPGEGRPQHNITEENTSLLPETGDLGSDGHKLSANSRLVGSHSYPDVRKELTCLTEDLQGNGHQGYHSIDILDSVADNSFFSFW